MAQDTRSRKFLVTINNPAEHDFTHDKIKETLEKFKSITYWCMADEQGLEEKTPHTHLYIHFTNASRFSTIKKAFPPAHIDECRGTAQENYEYITKTGKHADTDKEQTRIEGTFEEWGEMPVERQGLRTDLSILHELILDGKTNCEIYEVSAEFLRYHTLIEQVRQDHRYQEHRGKIRDMTVVYIWGKTGVGKTRSVLSFYDMCDIYRVTDYGHPFDAYKGEAVLVFDEFRSQLKISDMLNYLDIYPLTLPSRYANKQACYSTVYIVSNEPLRDQYKNIQLEQPATWQAFLRRINQLFEFVDRGKMEPRDIQDHMRNCAPVPEWVRLAEEAEQEELPF